MTDEITNPVAAGDPLDVEAIRALGQSFHDANKPLGRCILDLSISAAGMLQEEPSRGPQRRYEDVEDAALRLRKALSAHDLDRIDAQRAASGRKAVYAAALWLAATTVLLAIEGDYAYGYMPEEEKR